MRPKSGPSGGGKRVAGLRRPRPQAGPARTAAAGGGALPVSGPRWTNRRFRPRAAGWHRAGRALGEQLQHLPGAPGPLQQAWVRAGARLVQLAHQGLSLLHGQLPRLAPQALQVGQQGGEVLLGDLCRGTRAGQQQAGDPGPWVPALPPLPGVLTRGPRPGVGATRGGVLESPPAGGQPPPAPPRPGRKEDHSAGSGAERLTGWAVRQGRGSPPPLAPPVPRPQPSTPGRHRTCAAGARSAASSETASSGASGPSWGEDTVSDRAGAWGPVCTARWPRRSWAVSGSRRSRGSGALAA